MLRGREKSPLGLVCVLLILLLIAWGDFLYASPGDGSAVIIPSSDVLAGSSGEWTVRYTAADTFISGIVELVIPEGWTNPQDTNGNIAGYVTVSTEGVLGSPPIDISNMTITVNVAALDTNETVDIVYGDETVSSSGNAVAQTNAQMDVEFSVSDDPTGNSPVSIDNSPVLDVVASSPYRLLVSPLDTTITAGDYVRYTLYVQDEYGNITPVSSDRTIDLQASKGSFYDTGDHVTEILEIIIPSGNSSVEMDYRCAEMDLITGYLLTFSEDDGITPHLITEFTHVLIDHGSANVSKCGISVDKYTIVADDSDELGITVSVKDQFENPVDDASVLIDATGSENSFTQPSPTSVDGLTGGTMRSTRAEQKKVTASVEGSNLNDSLSVTFEAGPVDLNQSEISADTDTVVADGTDEVGVTVTVMDQYDNPVAGSTVYLEVTGDGNTIVQPDGQTGSDGVATGFLKSIKSGMKKIKAMVDGYYLSDIDSVFFRAGDVDAAQSELSVDKDTVVADGSDQVTITVLARDVYGNTVGGASVELEATDTDGGNSLIQPVGNTDENGEATGTLSSTYAENKEIRSKINGNYIDDSCEVEFIPGPIDLTISSLSADKDTVVSDGIDEVSITVEADDAQGNPVSGASVEIEVVHTEGGNSITQPSSLTGESGTAVGYVRSTFAETKTIKATINGGMVSDSLNLVFKAGELDHFYITHDGSATAGVAESITVDVRDFYDNRLTAFQDTIRIYTDTEESKDMIDWNLGEANGTITGQSKDTLSYLFSVADNGIVTLPMIDEKAEEINIYASCEGVISSNNAILSVGHSYADSIFVIDGDNQRAVVNHAVDLSLVVGVEDQYGNLVSGETVTFSVTEGGGILDTDLSSPGIQTQSITDVDGLAYCEYWQLGTTSGYTSDRCMAEIAGGTSGSVVFTATTDHDQADSIQLNPPSGNITIDSPRIVIATLTDQFGNLVFDESINIYIKDTPADGTLSEDTSNPNATTYHSPTLRSGTTDSTGTISVVYNSPSQAGVTDSIDAYNPDVPATEVEDVNYTTVTSGATRLVVSDLGEGPFQAGVAFLFKILAVDDNGNKDPSDTSSVELIPESGSGLSFSLNDFGPEITQTDLINGEVTIYGRGTRSGDWNVDVNDIESMLNPTFLNAPIAPNDTVDHYDIVTSPSVSASEDISMTVSAQDRFDNLSSSASYMIELMAVEAADSTVPADSLLTVTEGMLSGGTYTGSGIQYHRAGEIRIEVSSSENSVKGYSDVIIIGHASPYQMVKITGDTSGVVAGDTVLIQSVVFDIYDNPVDGEAVSFTIQKGGGSLSSPQELSGIDGGVWVNLITGTEVGENEVRSAILDGNPQGRETNTFRISTVPSQVIDYVLLDIEGYNFSAGDTFGLSLGAYDQFGNLITSDSTSILVPVSWHPTIEFMPDTLTLGGGAANFMAMDTVVSTNRIMIEDLGGQQLSSWSDFITINPAPAYRIDKISGDTTGVIAGATTEMRVRVGDRFGNLVPNEIVHFVVTSDLGGSTVLTDAIGAPHDGLVLTDSGGSAICSLTTDTNSGVNTVKSYIDDGVPEEREKVEFAVSTAAGSIHYYTVDTAEMVKSAGEQITVDVIGYDENENRVYGDDSTLVDLDSDGSVVYDQDPVTLLDGAASVTAYETVAGAVVLSAQTLGGGALSYSDTLTILPEVPAGSITIESVTPDTITADGLSKCSITTNPITDVYGNIVSKNELITVTPSSGTVTSDDEDLVMDGVQRLTTVSGKISVFVQSSDTPGTHPVQFESVEGNATGSVDLVFAPQAEFVYGGYISPKSVVPGQEVQFKCSVSNNSPTGLYLDTATSIAFSDSIGNEYEAHIPFSLFIGGGETDTLVFTPTILDSDFLGGNYTPLVTLMGTDIYSSSYQEEFNVQSNALSLSFISVTGIVAPQSVVSRGDTVSVDVSVKNMGGRSVRLENIQLKFSLGLYTMVGDWSPIIPDSLSIGETNSYTRYLYVRPSSPLGIDTIDASALASVGGMEVSDNSADQGIDTWLIQSAADISYLDNSLSPDTVSPGQNHSFNLDVVNSGEATVILDESQTVLQFNDGTEAYQVTLDGEEALSGQEVTTLTFTTTTIPAAMVPGKYPVDVTLYGWENGGVLDKSLSLSDSVVVVSSADLEYSQGTAAPHVVSKNSTVSFQMGIVNNGGATVICNPALTYVSFGDGSTTYTAYLDQDRNNNIGSGENMLYFDAVKMPAEMSNGYYYPAIHISGFENGLDYSTDLSCSDSITVQEPSQLSINRIDVLPRDHITADQSREWTASVVVQNYGGATVRIDSLCILLFAGSTNVTDQCNLSPPDFSAGNDTIEGGEIDSFQVVFSDRSSNSMTTGTVIIEATVHGVDLNSMNPLVASTESGGKGSYLVQTPADPVILSVVPEVERATALQTRDWKVDYVLRNWGESDIEIDLDPGKSYPVFSSSDDFDVIYPDSLNGGGNILEGETTDTLSYIVDRTGSQPDLCEVNAEITAVEINSLRMLPVISAEEPAIAQVEIQSPAKIVINGLNPLQDPVTIEQQQEWSVDLFMTNTGGSDVDLILEDIDSTTIDIPGGTGFHFSAPDEMLGGGVSLGGGESGTLRFNADTTGIVAAGRRALSGSVLGIEINSGRPVFTDTAGIDSLTFQIPPVVNYTAGSLSPLRASRGTNIAIQLGLESSDDNMSTVNLEETETYVSFSDSEGDSFYSALSPFSQNNIPGGQSATLIFEGSLASGDINTGGYVVDIHLEGTENGNSFASDLSTFPDTIVLEEASQLTIESIKVPPSITAELQPAWDVKMVVRNMGEASVDLDLDPDSTTISFIIAGEGNKTGEYSIEYPDGLEISGNDTLAGGMSDTLLFKIRTTGVTTGTALVNGSVTGMDINSWEPLYDDTYGSGGSYMLIQSAGVPYIEWIEASRNRVTSGQITPWDITMEVTNQGGADLTLQPDSTYIYSNYTVSIPEKPGEFSEGGVLLPGGETRHITFSLTPTPSIEGGGDLFLDSQLGMIENNRKAYLYYNSKEGDTGSDTVRVQAPANLNLVSLVNSAPRSPYVNCGQTFPLILEVSNTGEAAAESVYVSLATSGSSDILNSPVVIDRLESGQSLTDSFMVTAYNEGGSEIFEAQLQSALDGNSGEDGLVVISSPVDSVALAEIQDPGDLIVESVKPSQSEVNAGQTVDWWLSVKVANKGEAPVEIEAPGAEDIEFYLDGMELSDYLVEPPAGFESGTPGLTLEGMSTDSLIYTILTTGNDTGLVDLFASISWTDKNQPDLGTMVSVQDSAVYVNEPSGVRIINITSDAPNNSLLPNTSVVNTGQVFYITVRVENTGGDDLDSVKVSLVPEVSGESSVIVESEAPQIDSGSYGDFVFRVTAAPSPSNEVLKASIDRAVSINTGEEIEPIQALESVENLVIQAPARLSCDSYITFPPGATDDTLSTSQEFVITAVVSNLGESQVDNSGRIELTLPGGFNIIDPVNQPSIRSFIPGEEISWELFTPSLPAEYSLSVEITDVPVDVNTAYSAAVEDSVAYLEVTVEEGAGIANCNLMISGPQGAVDDTISTEQSFDVEAVFTPSANSREVWIALEVPAGFVITGDSVVMVGSGNGDEMNVEWDLKAPADLRAADTLGISCGGRDANSGEQFVGCNPVLYITVEERASLDISSEIAGPPEAVDGEISVDLPFSVSAQVTRHGDAGVDLEGARLRLSLPEVGGYSFENPADSLHTFQPGEVVLWNLVAPSIAKPRDRIIVEFAQPLATDRNSGQPVLLDKSQIEVWVKTVAGVVTMSNISRIGNIPPYVVPRGTGNVPVMRIAFGDSSSYNVGLNSIDFSVFNGRMVTLPDPSVVVDSIKIIAGKQKFGVEVGSTNPVRLNTGYGFQLDPGEGDTVLVMADIAAGAPPGEVRIDIANGSEVNFTIGDEQGPRVGVVRDEDEGSISGYFLSGPMTVMSSVFEEYVHNYPNPFRAGSEVTRIAYFASSSADVKIRIYELTGDLVWTKDIKASESRSYCSAEGVCEVEWDGRNDGGEVVRNGVYICKIVAGSKSAIFKVAVAK